MLLIPIHKKVDWKHPPLITLLFIAANIVIFLAFQLDDDQEALAVIRYYQESGLAAIEYEPAQAYAEKHQAYSLSQKLDAGANWPLPYWVFALQADAEFIHALHHGEVIPRTSAVYGEWRKKRGRFEELYESITYVHYGLRPAAPTAISLFSHMFLHADFWHLFGNMVFLFAVGLLVEATMDKKSFLISYLLAGLGSASFDLLIRSHDLSPGIGASGAIAGLMGAYTVLYGLKPIRFFYFIGVYFDYIRLPAIVLLPLWLGNELVQMLLDSGSNVNFMAHVGGLCSGALIALVVRRALPSFSLKHVEEDERQQKLEQDLDRVRELMADYKPEQALPVLRRLRIAYPDNREVLTRSYDCSRVNAAGDEYHKLAHAIFTLDASDAATDTLVRETFNEYLKLARPSTRMTANLVCRLARRFVRQRATTEAERLVRTILAKQLACPARERILEGFIRLLEEQGREEDKLRYIKLIPVKESS